MNSDPNSLEPLTEATESLTGWSHLSKTALPLLGRVGTVIGGIFSMLAVFKQISGEIIMTVEGFVLVVAVLSSGIVVFYRTSHVVDGQKKSIFSYSHKARAVAAVVLVIASIFLFVFFIRLWNIANPTERPLAAQTARQTVLANSNNSAERGAKPAQTLTARASVVVPPPSIPPAPTAASTATATPSSTATPTNTATPLPPTRTPTATTATLDQITDVNILNKMGDEALTNKKYSQAANIFLRAIFVEATNAQAQYGLGQAYFYQNNLNAAIQPFQIALGLDLKLHGAHAYLGWIYDYRSDKAKAIAEYDVFLKSAPRDDPWRNDISDRIKQLTGKEPAPTLTPIGNPTATATVLISATATPTPRPVTATPTLSATPNK